MDFVVGLPKTWGKFDSIWVMVDRLTKSAHFIPVRIDYNAEQLAKVYVKEIVRLHGLPLSIISDSGTQFTSKFWRKLHDELGTQHTFSTVFNPQMDMQSERTIQVLEDMLRACVIDFGGHWDKFLPLCEFSYNNSYNSSIDMAPFEALYGRGCRSPIGWFEARDVKPLEVDLVKDAQDKVRKIQATLLAAQSRQKKYADHKVSPMKGSDEIRQERLALPPNLSGVHPEPIAILDHNVRKLRTKEIKYVKVQWNHRPVEETTWETKRTYETSIPNCLSIQVSRTPEIDLSVNAHYFMQAALAVVLVALVVPLKRELRNNPYLTLDIFSPFLRQKTKNKWNESGKEIIKFLRVSSLFQGHFPAAIDKPRLEDHSGSPTRELVWVPITMIGVVTKLVSEPRFVDLDAPKRMVNITYIGVRPVAPVNAPAEESAARGHGRGRGRGRSRGRGHGRVAPARDKVPVENVPEN
ncbi:hypothetical protein KY289_000855 [Solanum tuberosum]|nr:hypothetical protein KY289_000855 [Solanum tuberosum]